MKEKHINIDEFLKLTDKSHSLSSGTESLIYKSDDNLDVFKFFLIGMNDCVHNKCYILNSVSDITKEYPMPFLMTPKDLVIIDEEGIEPRPVGYTMPFIKGENLETYLLDDNISFDKKKELLTKTGKLLEKMKTMRQETGESFFLNDLHEDNIIVENNTEDLKILDIDSAYVRDSYVAPSKYLLKREFLKNKDKYPKEKENPIYGKQVLPNQNTEYYCYLVMILNTLLQEKLIQERSTLLSYHQLKSYIDYLEKLGLNKEIVTAFKRITENEDNINPYEYIEDIKEMPEASYTRYREYKNF